MDYTYNIDAQMSTMPIDQGVGATFSSLLATMAGTAAVIAMISLVIQILVLVANWKILSKAGEPGWKVLIPFYNGYVFYKVAWSTTWFFVTLAVTAVQVITLAACSDMTISVIVTTVTLAIQFAMTFMFNVRLAQAFGKTFFFGLGMILLNPLFVMILGFGKSKYVKAAQDSD